MKRRDVLKTAGLAVLRSVLLPLQSFLRQEKKSSRTGKRNLGRLKVSGIGLSVQNMSRTYQTTIPNRKEMHRIIRSAFDAGVTFFDAAEAYGPFEVERILGEGVRDFRSEVVIATKFDWNTDPKKEQMLPGTQQQTRAHKSRCGGDAQTPENRSHRPALPA
ncbi:aldo/keto reductase [Riemerella columbipharyngis]|uniref:Aldo/keto reductase family protein n=1 Tax=Riemerella columbipharyngis TaxID=1071918 RepID=A0A1G6ZIX2_9FLAO|nr:aldo/keto reductase [Riemerella columbipharyngis]SDE02599.1 Aldo/keto reductase family protein [Riemerella columbipharyngis]